MRGFTLVEVLIASFIIMISVTGFVALQSEYFRSDVKLNLRDVAIQLAQQKLDDLQQFEELETTAGAIAYNDIDDDQGGSIGAGQVAVNIKEGNGVSYTFDRSWTVVDQYFVDTDADGSPDTWLDEGDPGLPVPVSVVPGRKEVQVTISWVDQEGTTSQVSVDGSVAPVLIARSFRANNEVDNAKVEPKVNYTPGVAPDVIAYDLGNGETIETSKPVPEIDNQGDNNVVQFETVRYVDIPGQVDKLEQEDFLTVNCSCQLAGSGLGYTPSRTVFDGKELVVESGTEVVKTVGQATGTQQPQLCNACCRDHHDTSSMVNEGNAYREENNGPHKHYKRELNGSFTLAASAGDAYDEVCRFKRVNGFFELYPDWQLIDTIEFRDSYLLNSDRLSAYTQYTKGVIKADITGGARPAKPTDRDIAVPPGGYQLISRGIYLDAMTTEHKAALQEMIANGESGWEAFVPFYDINLTLLSSWASSDTNIATITNDKIQTIIDPGNDFYGTYSRGRVEALRDGSAVMTVSSTKYSSGITGSGPISPLDESLAVSDNSLTVNVDSKSSSERFFGLVGNINCLITVNGVQEACETNNNKKAGYVDLTRISITNEPSQFTCTTTIPKGKSTPFFSCNNISENWRGSIIFSFTKPGYTVQLQVRLPSGEIVDTDRIQLTGGLNATSTQEYELILNIVQ